MIWFVVSHRIVFSTPLKPQRLSWPFLFHREGGDVNGFWRLRPVWQRGIYLHVRLKNLSAAKSSCQRCGFVEVRCGEPNLLLVLKREPCLDAGRLHVKTHLDDVINVNNSNPFTSQSSTGRVECRGCRCEFRRLLLRWGLLHFAKIWYSHGNRRSNLAPISCPTVLNTPTLYKDGGNEH